MLGGLIIGSASTYGIYKSYNWLTTNEPDFERFMKYEDVKSTIITVKQWVKKNKHSSELKKQLAIIERLLHDIEDVINWRKGKYYRYFAWTSEKALIKQFKQEWIIFKVRIRVMQGLTTINMFQ